MVTVVRGEDQKSAGMFSYVRLEERVPRDHPLRAIRALVDAVLAELSPSFEALYARVGRPSVPPDACCGPRCCRPSTRSARSGC
jgi:transposase